MMSVISMMDQPRSHAGEVTESLCCSDSVQIHSRRKSSREPRFIRKERKRSRKEERKIG